MTHRIRGKKMADDNFGSLRPDDELVGLRKSLDDVALGIIEQGDSDLLFGGSSEEEARVFGSEINATDAPRIGAALGGIALANRKIQLQRQQKLNRINKIQDRLSLEAREKAGLSTGILRERISQAGANSRTAANNQTSIQTANINNDGSLARTALTQSSQNARNASTISAKLSEGSKNRANKTQTAKIRASRPRGSSGTSAALKAQQEAQLLTAEGILSQAKKDGLTSEFELPKSRVGRVAEANRLAVEMGVDGVTTPQQSTAPAVNSTDSIKARLIVQAQSKGIEVGDNESLASLTQKLKQAK